MIFQSLWIGQRLPGLLRECLASFVRLGMPYHLYIYDPVDNIPPGIEIKDAHEIVHRSRIFRYHGTGSYAGFSNLFRYMLLFSKSGYWVDTDVMLIKPPPIDNSYIFATEHAGAGRGIASCYFTAPAGCAFLRDCVNAATSIDPMTLSWGEIGPRLMMRMADQHKLSEYQLPIPAVCPIPFWQVQRFEVPGTIRDSTFAVHIWHEARRQAELSLEEAQSGSLLSNLLRHS